MNFSPDAFSKGIPLLSERGAEQALFRLILRCDDPGKALFTAKIAASHHLAADTIVALVLI